MMRYQPRNPLLVLLCLSRLLASDFALLTQLQHLVPLLGMLNWQLLEGPAATGRVLSPA